MSLRTFSPHETFGPPPLVQLRCLDYRYGERKVLDGISFTLEPGSRTALIGPNGAGKTTLLRLMAGALKPPGGVALLRGNFAFSMNRTRRARCVALVPQQLEMPFDFTVEQMVEQGRSPYLGLLRGFAKADRRAVDRAIALADVGALRHRVFNELSGGERQRVKIALGLAQEPELLLLDEPTQNLDIGRQVELLDLLEHLHGEGLTIYASMHDLPLVPGNFDTVHLLAGGKGMVNGTPEDVMTPAALAAAFRCAPGRHPMLKVL